MTTPVKADVDAATQDTLIGLAVGDQRVLEEVLAFRESEQASTGLDARTFSLVKIAALIALDAPPASYLWGQRAGRGGHAAGHARRAACDLAAGRRAQGDGGRPRTHTGPRPRAAARGIGERTEFAGSIGFQEAEIMRRRRPLMRAAVIGGGAYAVGRHNANRNAEQAQQEDQQNAQINDLQQQQAAAPPPPPQQAYAPPPPEAAPAAGPSLLDQLNQLDALHQSGALTDNEFTAAKAKLLSS
jgi:hypothetical protein